MRRLIPAAALAASLPLVPAAPAMAQTTADQARWEAALERYQEETQRYYREWDRYRAAQRADPSPREDAAPLPDDRYTPPPSSYRDDAAPDAPPADAPPMMPPAPPAEAEDAAPPPEAPPPAMETVPEGPPPPIEGAPPATPDIVPQEHDDRFDPGYDAARYYRDAPEYRERVLARQDRVYRGSDDHYYCQRSDGTTGLIVGSSAGAFGGLIDGGHSRTVGTLLGATSGGLAGEASDERKGEIRCR